MRLRPAQRQSMPDPRQTFVETGPATVWLEAQGVDPSSLQPLPGDVSVRRYARVAGADGAPRIVAYCPPPIVEVCARFLRTTELLESVGVRTARVYAAAPELGLAVVEDLGPQTLFDAALDGSELRPFYRSAVEAIRRLTELDRDAVGACNPPLDGALLRRELDQTWRLFLSTRPVTGDATTTSALRAALDEVCSRLAADEAVPCHRDFMVRNLIALPSGELAVIDHQDLRLGPPFYDLASLLNDSLFPPPEIVEPIVAELAPTSAERRAYHRAALQRSLKAIGTFVAFAERGNDRHLPLVGPTLQRAAEQLPHLPETAALATELTPLWQAFAAGTGARRPG